MKFILLIVVIILTSCNQKRNSDVLANKDSIETSDAEVQFDKVKVDFGTIPQDTLVTAIYHLKNIGIDTLIIKDIQPDCSCTSFYVSKYKIAPNDTASVKLEINTFHKRGKLEQYTVLVTNTQKKFHSLKNSALVK